MKSGICPKCGSDEVYTNQLIKPRWASNSDHTTKLGGLLDGYAVFEDYCCTACGYVESYLTDERQLAKVREKWFPANVLKRKNEDVEG